MINVSQLEHAVGNWRKPIGPEREGPLELVAGTGALALADELRFVEGCQLTAKSLAARRVDIDLFAESNEPVVGGLNPTGFPIAGEVLNDIVEEGMLGRIEVAGARRTSPAPEQTEETGPVEGLAVSHPAAVPPQRPSGRARRDLPGSVRFLDESECPIGCGHRIWTRTGNERFGPLLDLLGGGRLLGPQVSLSEELLEFPNRQGHQSAAGVAERDAVPRRRWPR